MFEELRDQFREGRAAGKDAAQRDLKGQHDPALLIILLVITLFGALLFELLGYYTKWSFIPRIGLSVLAVGLAQFLAARFFNRVRPKA